MTTGTLHAEWAQLLRRRSFAASLAVYGRLLDLWAAWSPPRPLALGWSPSDCERSWHAGVPLLAAATEAFQPADVEDLLGDAMEVLASVEGALAEGFQRFAEAWDRGAVGPQALLPARGRLGDGSAERESGITTEAVGVLAWAGLRPALEAVLAPSREHLGEHGWTLGVCPFCGAPPGFVDILDDGRRRLACHLCGGAWLFRRLQCPLCGDEEAKNVARLEPEGLAEEGYVVVACRRCQGYLKELDRRVRWNGVTGILEDWGSPHLDLVASGQGYWRPIPSVLTLVGR
jgi:hypothetical protein